MTANITSIQQLILEEALHEVEAEIIKLILTQARLAARKIKSMPVEVLDISYKIKTSFTGVVDLQLQLSVAQKKA